MSYESIPMHKDPVFDAGGAYELAVEKNVCLHRESTQEVFKCITNHLTKIRSPKPLRVLDLACGGKPFILSEVMRRSSSYQFDYTGIDINPDQVNACKKYPFSDNVKTKVIEGNVWQLKELPLQGSYDIVFMGLNTHHAVPEEILYAARDIYQLLKPGGLFLNHDLFRPSNYPYLRRPDWNPNNKKESMRFVSKERLKKANIPTPLKEALAGNTPAVTWREEWLAMHKAYLLAKGHSFETAKQGVDHMWERDYPIAAEEMAAILKQVGFNVTIHSYQNNDYPIPEFFRLVKGEKI